MFLLIFFLLFALITSFICSLLEATLLSISPTFIQTLEHEGNPLGRKLKSLKENINRPLSAILTVNTIANTVGAAGVGAQATVVFGSESFGLISGLLTFLILIFSEILPKSIGTTYWRKIIPYVVKIIFFLIFISYPLVVLSQLITNFVSKNKVQPITSREEIAAMATIGEKEGIFEESESRIINNLVRFKSIKVENIMTPRTVVVAASETITLVDFFNKNEYKRFSRIPIYDGTIDNVTGYILKYDLLEKLANDQHNLTLKDIKREMIVIYENRPIPQLFELLVEKREHIALVMDEYGGMAGICSMEDVMETLLGLEIMDESDDRPDMQQLARERWEMRAAKLGILPINGLD